MLAIPVAALSDWIRDDLPDLLWPLILVKLYGGEGAVRFRQVQEQVLEMPGAQAARVQFDGRLTSIEAIPLDLRDPIAERLAASPTIDAALPRELLHVLDLYERVPGSWLFERLRPQGGKADAETLNLLAEMIVDAIRDGHTNALVKTAPLGWLLLSGRIRLPSDVIDKLRDYPTDLATRPAADSFIRAFFPTLSRLTPMAGNPVEIEPIQPWAASFWRQNWHLSPCLPEEQADLEGQDDEDREHSSSKPSDISEPDGDGEAENNLATAASWVLDETIRIINEFLAAVMDPLVEVDLYDPAKHEVLAGMVNRAAREVFAIGRSPHQWSGEHGAHTMRLLIESCITMKWMIQRGGDIFTQFQRYGRGKAKLMRRHMENLAEDLPNGAPDDLEAAIKHLRQKGGGEWGDEFQEVNLDATFAGLSVRQMADNCGELDLYRHAYQPQSGVTHGEWWAIDDYAMQRCMNPLHRFHAIPSMEPDFPATKDFGGVLVSHLRRLAGLAESALTGTA